MSEFAPPSVPDDPAVDPQEPLSAQTIDGLLSDFRSWLHQSAVPLPAVPPAAEEVDLATLVAQFVALKHEVNLQTKATRTQQQQNTETLQQLGRALETLEARNAIAEQAEQQGQEEQLRPLLKTLVDLWDALALAQRETQRLYDGLKPLPEPEAVAEALPPPLAPPTLQASPLPAPAKRSFWARLFGSGGSEPDPAALAAHQGLLDQARKLLAVQHAQLAWQYARMAKQHERLTELTEKQQTARQNEERLRTMLTSVLTGYTMSLQRLERALAQHGLEPLKCVGQPFDPETMEVVEVVAQAGRAGTEVIDEVRRGYLRRGRVFRYAQVRVAKPA